MNNDFYTLEDIVSKYPVFYDRKYYSNIEEDIVKLYNNTQFISKELLDKCDTDITGKYDHICSQWYKYVNENDQKHREFNSKAILKKNTRAMRQRALFHDDISSDEKILLLKEIYNLDPTEISILEPLSLELLKIAYYGGNIDNNLILEANIYLQTGLTKNDPSCIYLCACFELEEGNFNKARELNKLSYELYKMNPFCNMIAVKKRFDSFNLKIDKEEDFAIKYHGYIKK